jgi:hypothetical protein
MAYDKFTVNLRNEYLGNEFAGVITVFITL